MKVKMTEGELQQIKDAALYRFKSEHNQAVSSDLYPGLCYILAFLDFVNKKGVPLELVHPKPAFYESVDSD